MRRVMLVLVSFALALSGVGELMACQATESKTAAVEKLNDDSITAAIKGKLAADNVKNMSAMSFAKVDVQTKEGMVILSGVVPNSEQKARVGQWAREVKGVKGVTNNLQVQTAKQR